MSDRPADWLRFILVMVLLSVITHVPLLVSGYPRGHDASYHLKWLYHFSTQLKGGDLYPRWLAEMSGGLGGPSFYYYPPASYYLASAVSLFIDPLTHGHYVMAVNALLMAVIGALGTFLFCRAYLSRGASLFAVIVFLVVPYRIVIDLYLRGDIAELASISVIPYLFLVGVHLGQSVRRVFVITALSTALIVLTHPLVAMIILPFSFSFRLLDALRSLERIRWLLVYSIATFLGLALSCFYILPALLVENSASAGWDLFVVYDSFLFKRPVSPVPQIALLALAAILVSAVISLLGWLVVVWLSGKDRILPMFFTACALVCTFMLFEVSAPVYRLFSPLERMQFPWRYTTALTFFACIAMAFVFDRVSHRLNKGAGVIRSVMLVVVLVWLVLASVVGGSRAQNGFTTKGNLASIQRSHDAPEYRLSELAKLLPDSKEPLDFEKVTSDVDVDYSVIQWTENTMEVTALFEAGHEYQFARQYFGHWRLATADGNNASGSVQNTEGLVTYVPLQNTNSVLLVRDEFQAVTWGNRISLMAGIVILISLMLISRGKQGGRTQTIES
ncbi:6-pyruvoyl-tetrahydropterin synthase-related protein [Granulosicoccus sp. 3-233]|uniref:6-pyruvoyl-tetrahydropterin synthase-related protein n=1 Tax=Granulosicoccus sp. 3-233 TaxID=3417969 RepID=UPI003D329F50